MCLNKDEEAHASEPLRMGCQQKIYDFAAFYNAFEHLFNELQLVLINPYLIVKQYRDKWKF